MRRLKALSASRVPLLVFVLLLCGACSSARTTSPSAQKPAPVPGPTVTEKEQREAAPQPAVAIKFAQEPTAATSKYLVHKVRYAGETLSAIARWYTGKGANWPALARANPGLNPDRIRIGDTIKIPEMILTTRDPMPAASAAKPAVGKKAPSRPDQDKALFGPIEAAPPKAKEELFGPIDKQPSQQQPGEHELSRPLETLD